MAAIQQRPRRERKVRLIVPMDDYKEKTPLPSVGVIRFEVDNIFTLDRIGRFSPEVNVGGILWMVNIFREEIFGLHGGIECIIDQESEWSCDLKAEFVLVHPRKRSKNHNEKVEFKFDQQNTQYNTSMNFGMNWKVFIENAKFNEFIVDGNKIIVEVRMSISNRRGILIVSQIDVTDPREPHHDVAFVIDGEKIYANKAHLSLHSPVFNAMFFGEFTEKNKDEIELPDIDRKEFVGLLKVIYSPSAKITDANAEYILDLGDRFQFSSVIDKVEEFLINRSSRSLSDKIFLSDQFRLAVLQENCLNLLDTVENVQEILEFGDCFQFSSVIDKVEEFLINRSSRSLSDKIFLSDKFKLAGLQENCLNSIQSVEDFQKIEGAEIFELLSYVMTSTLRHHTAKMICPPSDKITEANAEYLLRLGDRYKIPSIAGHVEEFLINRSSLAASNKLFLSDHFRLPELQKKCLDSITVVTAWEIDMIKNSEDYEFLSEKTKSAVNEKARELVEIERRLERRRGSKK